MKSKTMGDNCVLEEDDSVDNYKLVMSDAGNYHTYLQLVHTSSVDYDEEEECEMMAHQNGFGEALAKQGRKERRKYFI